MRRHCTKTTCMIIIVSIVPRDSVGVVRRKDLDGGEPRLVLAAVQPVCGGLYVCKLKGM